MPEFFGSYNVYSVKWGFLGTVKKVLVQNKKNVQKTKRLISINKALYEQIKGVFIQRKRFARMSKKVYDELVTDVLCPGVESPR